VVLSVTGVYQSWRQLGSWSALTGTSYGRLLLLKVGLVAVLLGIAYVSRKWTARLAERVAPRDVSRETQPVGAAKAGGGAAAEDPRRAAQLARQQAARESARQKQMRDADPDRTGLRRSVLAEAAVAVALLAVTTVLTSTEPGRAAELEAGRGAPATAVPDRAVKITLPFDTGGRNGKGSVRFQLDPGRVGANTLHLWAESPDGQPLDLPEIKVAFTLSAKEIGPLPVVPERAAPGHWTASGVQLPLAGEWLIEVTVRTSEIDQTTVQKNVKIG
jgi:copper transport protein